MAKLTMSKDLVLLQSVAEKEELFIELCAKAQGKGWVEAQFCQELLSREKEYPTGLDTPIPIAIPHVGTHCLKSFLALATLKEHVLFENMDGSGEMLEVKIILLFGIVDPQEQVDVLKKFSTMFQDKAFLERIYKTQNTTDLQAVLKKFFDGMLIMES